MAYGLLYDLVLFLTFICKANFGINRVNSTSIRNQSPRTDTEDPMLTFSDPEQAKAKNSKYVTDGILRPHILFRLNYLSALKKVRTTTRS